MDQKTYELIRKDYPGNRAEDVKRTSLGWMISFMSVVSFLGFSASSHSARYFFAYFYCLSEVFGTLLLYAARYYDSMMVGVKQESCHLDNNRDAFTNILPGNLFSLLW
jgi:hypothetical protein